MNSDKQIDEMAKDLCHTETCEAKKIGTPCYQRCKAYIYAERAVDKGYRKASEVASEVIEEFKNIAKDYLLERDLYLVTFKNALNNAEAELKKKYTEANDGT